MNKKIALFALLLLLPLALFACGGEGAGKPSDTAPPSQETDETAPLPPEVTGISVLGVVAERGGLATVTVSVKDNPGFEGVNLRLYYDGETLTPVSATGLEGGLFTSNASIGGTKPADGGAPYVTLVWAAAMPMTEDGEIFTVTFRVKAESRAQEAALSLGIVELQKGGEEFTLPLHTGQIKILEKE